MNAKEKFMHDSRRYWQQGETAAPRENGRAAKAGTDRHGLMVLTPAEQEHLSRALLLASPKRKVAWIYCGPLMVGHAPRRSQG